MTVIAKGRLGDHEIDAEVVNPGGWWGKLWLIEVGLGYSSVYYAIEAGSEQDALDEFADSKHGHHIHIDIEVEGGDYGTELHSGDTFGDTQITSKCWANLKGELVTEYEKFKYLNEPCYLGNAGTPCDTQNILIHGPMKDFVYFDAEDEDCQNIPPELYEGREKRWSIIEDTTDKILKDDFRTVQEAHDYLDSHGLDWHDYTFEEL